MSDAKIKYCFRFSNVDVDPTTKRNTNIFLILFTLLTPFSLLFGFFEKPRDMVTTQFELSYCKNMQFVCVWTTI